MSDEMATEFARTVEALSKLPNLRVVILTGAGKAFSAGGHLAMLERKQQNSGEQNRQEMHVFYVSFLGILGLGVPLIAAINGSAIGAGLCLACACDIRVASDDAKLGFTFLRLGLHPGMGATFLLPRIIGSSAATELLLTGRVIDAQQSRELGLVSRVVPKANVLAEAEKVAQEILSCGPQATAQLLETMRQDLSGLRNALAREALCQGINYTGSEFKEGLAAIREKRPAKF
jgi:enoyl-CoA hydratase/carnithine racemase